MFASRMLTAFVQQAKILFKSVEPLEMLFAEDGKRMVS